jgi:hypothetical protein
VEGQGREDREEREGEGRDPRPPASTRPAHGTRR